MEMGSERMLKYGLKNMWRKLEIKLINNKIKLRRGREVTVHATVHAYTSMFTQLYRRGVTKSAYM
jgi:hypothetical protein